MRLWKVFCMEDKYPGLWRRFFLNQVVAVGFPALRGNRYGRVWRLDGRSPEARWSRVRKCLKQIQPMDRIVVQLKDHRVARIGEVVRLQVGDDEWKPLVPKSKELSIGEMGRRICVRWELADAPLDFDTVIRLPEKARFSPGQIRPIICRVTEAKFRRIEEAIRDEANRVPLLPHRFRMESAISDYIGTYPHRLEEGLLPYIPLKRREHSFIDKTRPDVLLGDRNGNPVVVECKQGTPSLKDLRQLRRYMRKARQVTGNKARGILVHGGADLLPTEVRADSRRKPSVEIIRYKYTVEFFPAT